MAPVPEAAKTPALVFCLLAFGAFCHINAGRQQTECGFDRPGLMTLFNAMAQSSLLLVYIFSGQARTVAKGTSAPKSGLLPGAVRPRAPIHAFALPSVLDFVATSLSLNSMRFLDPATAQMLRSSSVIHSAVLAVVFSKRNLQAFHWVAVGTVFLGVFIVVSTDLWLTDKGNSKAHEAWEQFLGAGSMLLGAFFIAARLTAEETIMRDWGEPSPERMAGFGGAWGCLVALVYVAAKSWLPTNFGGDPHYLLDGLRMIARSGELLVLVITMQIVAVAWIMAGAHIAKRVSAVFRSLLSCSRTPVTWAAQLFLFYCTSTGYGAPWKEFDWVKMIGFSIIVAGTLLYNEVLPAPACLRCAAGEARGAEGLGSRPPGAIELGPGRPQGVAPEPASLAGDDPRGAGPGGAARA